MHWLRLGVAIQSTYSRIGHTQLLQYVDVADIRSQTTLIPRSAVGGGLQITMGITSVLLVDLFPGTGGAITASVSRPQLSGSCGCSALMPFHDSSTLPDA